MFVSQVKVAIFGSWRNDADQTSSHLSRDNKDFVKNKNSFETFKEACFNIGKSIALGKHTVIVASDAQSTVDFHVVAGILSVNTKINHKAITVIRSRAKRSSKDNSDCSRVFEDQIQKYPEIFQTEYFDYPFTEDSSKQWEYVHDEMISKTDRVIIIGGGSSTHRVANKALAEEKLLVPIGTFGGAGEDILKILSNIKNPKSIISHSYRTILNSQEWNENELNVSLYALGVSKDPNSRHKIFINYRRTDSSDFASNLYESLTTNIFQKNDIFLDKEGIGSGEKFRDVISKELDKTKVFICLIGDTWLKASNPTTGRRRLDEEDDYVREEITFALTHNIKIIPVLININEELKSEWLPREISELTNHNYHFISTSSFNNDFAKLLTATQEAYNEI